MQTKSLILLLISLIIVGCSPSNEEETIILTPVVIVSTSTPSPALAEVTQEIEQIESDETGTVENETRDNSQESPGTNTQTNTVVQPVSQTINTSTTSSTSNCPARSDLPVYTVVAGDTLFSIATRASMAIDEIVSLNCLTDRNVISVGQQLYLTRTNTINGAGGNLTRNSEATSGTNTNTTTTTTTGDYLEGTVVLSPFQSSDGTSYTISPNRELTVRWMGMPINLGISQVEFTYVDARSINSPVSIGIDSDMSNGAQIQWTPPADVQGTIHAGARVGGQLHHTARAQTASVTIAEPVDNSRIGAVVISPWQSNNGNQYTVNTSTTLDVRWQGMPTDRGLVQVEFIYDDAASNLPPISIGIDSDLSDGAHIDWNAPADINGTVYASARLPGQQHQGISSQLSYVTADNTPLIVGPRGALSVDPNLQAGTPEDWGDYIVEAGATVTVRWTGVDPEEYNTLRAADLHFYPDGGGDGQLIQHDNNRADGFAFTWTVPDNVSGHFEVHGVVGNTARGIFSPRIHVRTQ